MKNYNFGNYICSLREKKGLSQSQLGEKLGVSNKAVSKWENGGAYPSSEIMYPLAKELGVSIEELYKAISDSKSEKTKKRKLLDRLVVESRLIIGFLVLSYVVLLILHLIFGNLTDKYTVAFLSIVVGAIIHVFFRVSFFVIRKNPLSPSGYIDLISIFFLGVGIFSALTNIINFVSFFPNGFYPGAGVCVGIISGVLFGNKKRI